MSAGADDGARWTMLRRRAELMARLRQWFAAAGVVEVDTPLRAPRPLPEAHIAPLTCDGGVLLPSPELWMKALLADGAGDIYQLGHVFRRGERGRLHREEFLLCEWYRRDTPLPQLMQQLAALLAHCGVPGALDCRQQRYEEVFEQCTGVHPLAPAAQLRAAAQRLGVSPAETGVGAAEATDAAAGAGYWRDLLMGLCVQPGLGGDAPLWLTDYPLADSPLARASETQPQWAQRFEVFWRGVELANGCREETDGTVIAQRLAAAGLSSDWRLPAIPDCAGVALGVDRLLMLLSGVDDLAAASPCDGL